jgi:hypothetical protein
VRHRSAEDFRTELLRIVKYEGIHAVLVKGLNKKAKLSKKELKPLKAKAGLFKPEKKEATVKREVKAEVMELD